MLAEAGLAGAGPSGRNGGFCNALWFWLPTIRERFGDSAARELALAAQASVDAIGSFCDEQHVDAWYRRGGYMQRLHRPGLGRRLRRCDRGVRRARPAGRLPGAERGGGPVALCLAGLPRRRLVSGRGDRAAGAPRARAARPRQRAPGSSLFENTPVDAVSRRGGDVVVRCGRGQVVAAAAVMATGGALVGLPRLRRRLTLTSSHMVITEPVPDLLEEIGWTGGECITDSRAMIHYFRTTPDGRIAFGWGGGRVVRGARTGGRAEIDPEVIAEVERHLVRFFPGLRGRRIELAWGGPIDVSPSHLPVVVEIDDRIHAGFGYTGHGVGPSQMVGRSLASLALERRDAPASLAYVEPEPLRVPPEPFRYVGGRIIRRAILRQEAALERGERPGSLTRLVAGIPERVGIHVGR